jgi:Domain of unknown function (DUF4412)
MKKLLFLLIGISFATVLHADMTVVQKVTTGAMMGQPPKNMTLTQYYKGPKSRIDINPTSYMIIDTTEGKMYTVDATKKTVSVMSREMLAKTVELGMSMMGGTNFNVNKTGKSQTINGFKCDEYTVTGSTVNIDAWVTEDVNVKELEAFRGFGQDLIGKAMAGLPGLAIKSESKINLMGQEMTGNSEVVSVSKDAVAASLFVIPADFQVKEVNLPKMPH